jgi:hypothetical protein
LARESQEKQQGQLLVDRKRHLVGLQIVRFLVLYHLVGHDHPPLLGGLLTVLLVRQPLYFVGLVGTGFGNHIRPVVQTSGLGDG